MERFVICGKKAERRERDNIGVWTGKYVCIKHFSEYYNKRIGCGYSLINSLSDLRTGNQDPDSNNAKVIKVKIYYVDGKDILT